jgi:hypothetical protein
VSSGNVVEIRTVNITLLITIISPEQIIRPIWSTRGTKAALNLLEMTLLRIGTISREE